MEKAQKMQCISEIDTGVMTIQELEQASTEGVVLLHVWGHWLYMYM